MSILDYTKCVIVSALIIRRISDLWVPCPHAGIVFTNQMRAGLMDVLWLLCMCHLGSGVVCGSYIVPWVCDVGDNYTLRCVIYKISHPSDETFQDTL